MSRGNSSGNSRALSLSSPYRSQCSGVCVIPSEETTENYFLVLCTTVEGDKGGDWDEDHLLIDESQVSVSSCVYFAVFEDVVF